MYLSQDRLGAEPDRPGRACRLPAPTTLEREVALGARRPLRDGDDAGAALIQALGDAHEQSVLAEMRSRLDVAEIPRSDDLAAAEQQTLEAMNDGVDVIYQATFFDGRWRGHADFLFRVDLPSTLGDWSYEVADAKLARRVKAAALLQMCVYAGWLEELQGAPPESLTVILGSADKVSVPHVDVAAYTRRTVGDFERWLDDAPTTYPVRVPHRAICPWAQHCQQQWRADDDLVLVPQMRRNQREHFREVLASAASRASAQRQIPTSTASAPSATPPSESSRRRRASRSRRAPRPTPPHEPVLPVEPNRGLALLPEPLTSATSSSTSRVTPSTASKLVIAGDYEKPRPAAGKKTASKTEKRMPAQSCRMKVLGLCL